MTKTIVFIGDSVTFGIRPGVVREDTFVYKIGHARGFVSIINAGVSSNSSSQGLARFTTDVLDKSPQVICIMFGINDVSTNVPVDIYRQNLQSMVQQSKAAGIKVTLMTPNVVRETVWIEKFPLYLEAVRNVAFQEGVKLIDIYRAFESAYFHAPTTF